MLSEHIAFRAGCQGRAKVFAQRLGDAVAPKGSRQVVAGIQQAQHADGQSIRHLAGDHVHLLHSVVERCTLAARLLHHADGLQQVAGHIGLRVDRTGRRCRAHVGPLARHGLERFADRADVVVGRAEHRLHQIAIAVCLVHQRGLQSGDTGRREPAAGIQHAGHVLPLLLQLANESTSEVPIGGTVECAGVERIEHAVVDQRRIGGRLLRGRQTERLTLALRAHVRAVVLLGIQAHQHRRFHALDHSRVNAVLRAVGQQLRLVALRRAALVCRAQACGAAVVQGLDDARMLAVEHGVYATVGKVGRLHVGRFHHCVLERHALAIAHHSHITTADGMCSLHLIAVGKHHGRAILRRTRWTKTHVVGGLRHALHLHHAGRTAAVPILDLRRRRAHGACALWVVARAIGLERIPLGPQLVPFRAAVLQCRMLKATLLGKLREGLGLDRRGIKGTVRGGRARKLLVNLLRDGCS